MATEYRALLEQALEVIIANTVGKDALKPPYAPNWR